jgi:protein phosphatase 1 regulatory subunit 10
VKAAPPPAPIPEKTVAAVSKAVELGDDDLFGGAKKSAPAPVKAPVKTVTKITMEKKVAPPPSVSTKKPSVSVSDLINKNSKATKVGAAPPQRETKQETMAASGGGGETQGKKRKRKSVTWASEDMLEQVRVFEKDAKQPKEVAFPDPVRDGMDASALERRDREVEAERKAAAKQHQRRLDEMRAYVPWRTPRAVVLPPDPDAHEPITPGCDSEEFQRILRIEAERPSVKYKRVTDIPDSPAEAPNEDDQLDLANTPAFSLEFQAEPAVEPAPAQYAAPPLAAPAFDASALAALAASLQQGPAAAPPPTPSYVQPHIPAQPAVMPMNYAPAPAPAPKQVTVGGAPVPVQNNIVVNGKTYRGVCAFFNTPRGCNWGDKCGYLHQAGINP